MQPMQNRLRAEGGKMLVKDAIADIVFQQTSYQEFDDVGDDEPER
jgi:hypothetical protein